MKRAAVDKARDRLASAKARLEDLEKSKDYASARRYWYDFLLPSNAIFSILEQGTKGFPKCEPWFGRKKHERRTDPLLRYLHHARNADEHNVPSVTELERQKIELLEGDKPVAAIEDVVGNAGKYAGKYKQISDEPTDWKKTTKMRIYPDRAKLIRVFDSGAPYDPPTEHLGAAIEDIAPISVARLMVQYVETMIEEAEALVVDMPQK